MKEDKLFNWLRNNTHWVLFIGIILIITSPFLFTRLAFFDTLQFSETGQIGDTIGGLTSPIISLIGAILVYLSFKEQNLANKQQEGEREISLFLQILNEVKSDIKEFNYRRSDVFMFDGGTGGLVPIKAQDIATIGLEALSYFAEDLTTTAYQTSKFFHQIQPLNSLYYILQSLNYLATKIGSSNLTGFEKEILINRIITLYNSQLFDPVGKINPQLREGRIKGDPESIAEFERLMLTLVQLKYGK